jgi:hypothetical protein
MHRNIEEGGGETHELTASPTDRLKETGRGKGIKETGKKKKDNMESDISSYLKLRHKQEARRLLNKQPIYNSGWLFWGGGDVPLKIFEKELIC